MEPVFTIPYSEYAVAQQLRSSLPVAHGYSFYAPMSRQEKGVDLILTRRHHRSTSVATIQVKSSRTYSPRNLSEDSKEYRYNTWFNNFDVPAQADFIVLIALYPPDETRNSRRLGSWWAPVTLLFSHTEMSEFLSTVRTVGGKRDKMFGFGFNDARQIFQTRGDQFRRRLDYSSYLLDRRISDVQQFLAAPPKTRLTLPAV
jgi:hypothetical protein